MADRLQVADNTEAGQGEAESNQLTGYSWNPDLLTAGAISSICGGLDFNNVVLLKGQHKFS